MFTICGNKGFHLDFPNGVRLSTQCGEYNYCEHNISNKPSLFEAMHNTPTHQLVSATSVEELRILATKVVEGNHKSVDAEIAIFDANDSWLTEKMEVELFGNNFADDVKGYVTQEDWFKIFEWCKNYKDKTKTTEQDFIFARRT